LIQHHHNEKTTIEGCSSVLGVGDGIQSRYSNITGSVPMGIGLTNAGVVSSDLNLDANKSTGKLELRKRKKSAPGGLETF
jgi:hypothetical protein